MSYHIPNYEYSTYLYDYEGDIDRIVQQEGYDYSMIDESYKIYKPRDVYLDIQTYDKLMKAARKLANYLYKMSSTELSDFLYENTRYPREIYTHHFAELSYIEYHYICRFFDYLRAYQYDYNTPVPSGKEIEDYFLRVNYDHKTGLIESIDDGKAFKELNYRHATRRMSLAISNLELIAYATYYGIIYTKGTTYIYNSDGDSYWEDRVYIFKGNRRYYDIISPYKGDELPEAYQLLESKILSQKKGLYMPWSINTF